MNKARIVSIDDEQEFIDMLVSYFAPRGYEIDAATRLADGLEIVRQKHPDVVLIDLKMPGLDGDAMLSYATGIEPRPKIIFVSAYDDGGKTKTRLLGMGAYAYFEKPLSSLRILEATINRAAEEGRT